MEFYFETDDKLERKKYAEFLKSMLENCDNYRREDSDGAYVIAIDSPWGTGKTRFAKMLRNYLEDRTKDKGADSRPGKNASFNAIYYNSWETDFSDDALLPLIYAITKSPEFKMERFNKKSKVVLGKFLDAATAVAKISAYTILHNVAGEKVVELIEAGEEALTKKASNPLEKYEERLNLLNGFRLSLENVIKHTKQKKLVIIVDELDRCRPTFAIQTLELAKHLFAAKGLVFIFALDIKQLSNSVKTIYGQDLDATGYLCRFFDYNVKLPLENSLMIISTLYNSISYMNDGKIVYLKDRQDISPDVLIKLISTMSINASLSLRDLSTLMKYYHIMVATFLNKYTSTRAYELYFLLLLLKFKYNNFFSDLTSEKPINLNGMDLNKYLQTQLGFQPDELLKELTNKLISRRTIHDTSHSIFIDNREERNGAIIVNVEDSSIDTKRRIKISWKTDMQINRVTYDDYVNGVSFDLNLFFEDLVQWERIKNMSLARFFSNQLEMFDFTVQSLDQ